MSDCTEWERGRDSSGYGNRRFQGRWMGAHRAAWIEAHGPVPEGLCVLHACDNRPCVNLDHLFLGTKLDNARDRDAKGRSGSAKLSPDAVREIRARYESGETQTALAGLFGVTQSAVSLLVAKRTWQLVA